MVEQRINAIRQEKKRLMQKLNITSGKKFRKMLKKARREVKQSAKSKV